jgi:integrase
MAKVQRGWLRKKKYAEGMTWLFCYLVTRPTDGKRVENSKLIGPVENFPNKQTAWREVGKLGLEKYLDNPIGPEPKFKDIAEHWRLWELRKEGVIGKKGYETANRDEYNLDRYVLPRWGNCLAKSIKPTEVETWFEVLATTPQGKKNKPLMWPTIDKVNSVMSQVYSHAQRHGLISAEMDYNPFRSPKFGGVRCKTQSDYEAKVVSPEQMVAILQQLDRPETKLEWTAALVHAATALRPEECFALKWFDLNPTSNQILVQRAWSKGRLTDGKTTGSMKPVAMHPALADYLNDWRRESVYSKDPDWVFASVREKGRIPRSASTCGKKYLRPAAVAAGVLAEDDNSRFGWHNLRHSLATFFASNDVHPSVIQTMLRHSKQQTTARYIHPVNSRQIAAQGLYLDAIKIGRKRKNTSSMRRPRVESRVGEERRKPVTR